MGLSPQFRAQRRISETATCIPNVPRLEIRVLMVSVPKFTRKMCVLLGQVRRTTARGITVVVTSKANLYLVLKHMTQPHVTRSKAALGVQPVNFAWMMVKLARANCSMNKVVVRPTTASGTMLASFALW